MFSINWIKKIERTKILFYLDLQVAKIVFSFLSLYWSMYYFTCFEDLPFCLAPTFYTRFEGTYRMLN